LIGVLLAGMSLPALVLTYGLKDDFTFLASAHGYAYAGIPEPRQSIQLGRPLFGVLLRGIDTAIENVGALWVARLVSVLGLVLLAIVVYRALLRLTHERTSSACVALLMCSLPPFLVYAGWATLCFVPYSAALGGLAAFLASAASERSGRDRAWRLAAGGLLLLAALAIYQPTAMMFWVIALILTLAQRHERQAVNRLLRSVVIAGVPAMLGAYLILKIGVWTLGAASAQRAGLLTDVPAKLRWLPQPFGLALNLFVMPQSTAIAALVACVVVLGAVLVSRDCDRRTRLTVLAAAAAAVPLSFTPNIFSEENYATFRTVGPLAAIFALFTALVLVSLERDATARWARRASRGGLLALAAVSVILGFNHLRTLIALPLSREWRLLTTQVAHLRTPSNPIVFLAPDLNEGPITTPYGVRDEFGVPSAASTWADPAMTWLAGRQAGTLTADHQEITVTVAPSTHQPGITYIDMRDLKRLN
jgi:hypothetical protein